MERREGKKQKHQTFGKEEKIKTRSWKEKKWTTLPRVGPKVGQKSWLVES
jgi:hypothetical protein